MRPLITRVHGSNYRFLVQTLVTHLLQIMIFHWLCTAIVSISGSKQRKQEPVNLATDIIYNMFSVSELPMILSIHRVSSGQWTVDILLDVLSPLCGNLIQQRIYMQKCKRNVPACRCKDCNISFTSLLTYNCTC